MFVVRVAFLRVGDHNTVRPMGPLLHLLWCSGCWAGVNLVQFLENYANMLYKLASTSYNLLIDIYGISHLGSLMMVLWYSTQREEWTHWSHRFVVTNTEESDTNNKHIIMLPLIYP